MTQLWKINNLLKILKEKKLKNKINKICKIYHTYNLLLNLFKKRKLKF